MSAVTEMSAVSIARFWAKVDLRDLGPDECWLWRGALYASGYGSFRIGSRSYRAHRVAEELVRGSLAPGVQVLHRCDNPACVRPDHLFRGDPAANAADRHRKGRDGNHRGFLNGRAKFTDVEVRMIRARAGRGETHESIARSYDVHQTTVSRLVRGETYDA